MIDHVAWLTQDVTLPLWAFTCILLLPAAYFANLGKTMIGKKMNGGAEETKP